LEEKLMSRRPVSSISGCCGRVDLAEVAEQRTLAQLGELGLEWADTLGWRGEEEVHEIHEIHERRRKTHQKDRESFKLRKDTKGEVPELGRKRRD
jgi:hypothetical protein